MLERDLFLAQGGNTMCRRALQRRKGNQNRKGNEKDGGKNVELRKLFLGLQGRQEKTVTGPQKESIQWPVFARRGKTVEKHSESETNGD